MPAKMNMFISNGNPSSQMRAAFNTNMANMATASSKAPSSLNAPIISRIHNVRAGCNSCGKH